MTTDHPLPSITVVTPSYNQAQYLEAALRSVIDQGYPRLEYIVMDGGSTDGSAEIIEKYDGDIAYWTSEKDDGQSDALHRGFVRGTGDIITWLNSDDILLPGTLREVADAFTANRDCQWALGNVVWIDANGKILSCRKGEGYWSVLPRLGILSAYGPSAFFTRELYGKVGGLNTDLHYMMDTELWWRFAMSGASFHRLRRYSWALRLHADAKVSAHMFADAPSAAQERASRTQKIEREHMDKLIGPYKKSLPWPIKKVLHAARRLSSPQYLKGMYENYVWQGQPLDRFIETQ